MALGPTIYKCEISLSDLDRQRYDTLLLTVAKHPSETDERMMARVMAYCIHAQERLTFGKGISSADEPDIWLHTLDGQVELWIEVGEPSAERMRKASRIARQVVVYSFNTKASLWWEQNRPKCSDLPVSVFQFQWDDVSTLATFVQRKIELSVTISDGSAYVACNAGTCDLTWTPLSPG